MTNLGRMIHHSATVVGRNSRNRAAPIRKRQVGSRYRLGEAPIAVAGPSKGKTRRSSVCRWGSDEVREVGRLDQWEGELAFMPIYGNSQDPPHSSSSKWEKPGKSIGRPKRGVPMNSEKPAFYFLHIVQHCLRGK